MANQLYIKLGYIASSRTNLHWSSRIKDAHYSLHNFPGIYQDLCEHKKCSEVCCLLLEIQSCIHLEEIKHSRYIGFFIFNLLDEKKGDVKKMYLRLRSLNLTYFFRLIRFCCIWSNDNKQCSYIIHTK